ncbi:MAG: DNA repair protein RadA [Bacteriovoracaceae bacterium]|nr:DNA repair protein RadA [Bacteriovoracaceae bacterium]
MAKKNQIQFACQACGYLSPKWLGKCPDCQEWNSFQEEEKLKHSHSRQVTNILGSQTLSEIETTQEIRMKTGIEEFDRVVGGGMVEGSLTLIGGEPGIGKSTLLLEVSGKVAELFPEQKVLYISGEESTAQVAGRMKRLGMGIENLYILHASSWQNILEEIKKIKPILMILDSIQTTVSHEVASAPGTASQIREVTYELMNYAKANKLTCLIIGHITKEGNIAGPKILEHMVDAVVYFEGDQQNQYRLLRVMKNRFGNSHEVGIFEMHGEGLRQIQNPSQYFLESSLGESYGRALTCVMEGTRGIFVEVQALVVENKYGNGRRTTQGIDANRLSMLVAIIEKYFELPLSYSDIYLNVVGGIKLQSRDSDLAVIAALLSSYYKHAIGDTCVFLGEVGLTGEVRAVPFIERRINEIEKLNYKKLFMPKKQMEKKIGGHLEYQVIRKITDLKENLF